MLGVLLLVVPLAVGGVVQGMKLDNPDVAFVDATAATLSFLRVSTTGLLFMLLGNLLFALNIFAADVHLETRAAQKGVAAS